MTRLRILGIAVLGASVLALAFPVASQGQYIWGTSTAELTTDPGFEGYWKYCFEIGWDVSEFGHGVSHASMILGLEDCFCACDDPYFMCADPAGSGPGVGGCTVYYYCEFDCEGNPHFPGEGPTIKFEPDEDDCEPGYTGWIEACFYSLFEPIDPGVFPDVLGIKFATQTETGDLEGVLPFCECGITPVDHATWSVIKSIYRP